MKEQTPLSKTGSYQTQGENQINPKDSNHSNFVRYRRPPARDGHSGVLVRNKFLLVFGGDRHRMPFNDTYLLDIEEEFNVQGYLFAGTDLD